MATLNRLCLTLFVVSISAPLTGCTQKYSIGPPLTPEELDQIVTGKTTRQNLVASLGDPKDITRTDQTTTLIYESAHCEMDGDILKVRIRRLTIVLDEKEVVKGQRMDHLYREEVHSSREDSWKRLDDRIRDRS